MVLEFPFTAKDYETPDDAGPDGVEFEYQVSGENRKTLFLRSWKKHPGTTEPADAYFTINCKPMLQWNNVNK